MVPVGNKAKRLSSVNDTKKTIHHHLLPVHTFAYLSIHVFITHYPSVINSNEYTDKYSVNCGMKAKNCHKKTYKQNKKVNKLSCNLFLILFMKIQSYFYLR